MNKMAAADTSSLDNEEIQCFNFVDILEAGKKHMIARDDLQF